MNREGCIVRREKNPRDCGFPVPGSIAIRKSRFNCVTLSMIGQIFYKLDSSTVAIKFQQMVSELVLDRMRCDCAASIWISLSMLVALSTTEKQLVVTSNLLSNLRTNFSHVVYYRLALAETDCDLGPKKPVPKLRFGLGQHPIRESQHSTLSKQHLGRFLYVVKPCDGIV